MESQLLSSPSDRRTCKQCGEDFTPSLTHRRNICQNCYREIEKARYRKRYRGSDEFREAERQRYRKRYHEDEEYRIGQWLSRNRSRKRKGGNTDES